jgi:hypothetical protein
MRGQKKKRSEEEQKEKEGESEVVPSHFIFVVCVPPPFLPPA